MREEKAGNMKAGSVFGRILAWCLKHLRMYCTYKAEQIASGLSTRENDGDRQGHGEESEGGV